MVYEIIDRNLLHKKRIDWNVTDSPALNINSIAHLLSCTFDYRFTVNRISMIRKVLYYNLVGYTTIESFYYQYPADYTDKL